MPTHVMTVVPTCQASFKSLHPLSIDIASHEIGVITHNAYYKYCWRRRGYCCCSCPTCRAVSAFVPSRDIDAAVAGLPVSCPYVDAVRGTPCSWRGTARNFDDHVHLCLEQPVDGDRRGTKRKRSDDDIEEDSNNDDDDNDVVAPPPPKFFRFANFNFRLLGYRVQVDSTGVHFHADAHIVEGPASTPAAPQGHSADDGSTTVTGDDGGDGDGGDPASDDN